MLTRKDKNPTKSNQIDSKNIRQMRPWHLSSDFTAIFSSELVVSFQIHKSVCGSACTGDGAVTEQ